MPKSKIIKDLANGTVDTMVALKRVKVLLSELDNDFLNQWITYEITGYPVEVELPNYRSVKGSLIGSYFKGSMASHMIWKDVSIPLGKMPEDLKDDVLNVSFREGVESLKKLSEESQNEKGQLGKQIPADFFPAITNYNNDPYMIITSARVVVGNQFIQGIFSAIENRLLDILLILEKEFGILDDLDIDITNKSENEIQIIVNKLNLIIYNDESINIGDGNRIKESTIASKVN